jgi:hypothetical protein
VASGRILSPEFWTDVRMTQLSPLARLFYMGTWNFAYCDQGHLPDDAAELKFKILPADAGNGDDLLAELMGVGRIIRETTPGGKSFLRIPTFGDHQRKDDPRWARKCPICRDFDQPRKSTQEHARGLRGGGVEGSGLGGGDAQSARPTRFCSKHPNGTEGGCFACRDARIAQQEWDEAQKNKPTLSPADRRLRPHECPHKKVIDGCCNECGARIRSDKA